MLLFSNNVKIEKNDDRIKLSFDNGIYGVLEWPVYNFLYALNGASEEEARKFLRHFVADENGVEQLLSKILDYYPFLKFGNEDNKIVLPYFGKANSKLHLNRLRSFIPKMLVLQVTRACPMKCNYCYAGSNLIESTSGDDISLDVIEKILKEASALGIKKIDITGGDPFIRKDIFEILDLFEHYNISTAVSTKMILNDNCLVRLKNYSCIDEFQVSIDSIKDEEVFELLGVTDYVEKHLLFISRLVRLGFKVKTNSVLTRINIDNIFLLIERLTEIGVNKIVLSPYMSNLFNRNKDYFPSVEQYKKLSNLLCSMGNNHLIEYPIFLNDFSEESLYNKMNNSCSSCLDGFVISSSGEIHICERMSYFSEYSIGTIMENSILDIWNSKNIYRYHLLPRDLFEGQKCYDCKHFNYCVNSRGICFVHSLVLNGTIYSPDSSCLVQLKKERIY